MIRKVLVTGATGFVGRQVVRALSEKGIKLRLLVRSSKMARTDLLTNNSEIFISKDMFTKSSQWWTQQCKGVDAFVHLAWYSEPKK